MQPSGATCNSRSHDLVLANYLTVHPQNAALRVHRSQPNCLGRQNGRFEQDAAMGQEGSICTRSYKQSYEKLINILLEVGAGGRGTFERAEVER